MDNDEAKTQERPQPEWVRINPMGPTGVLEFMVDRQTGLLALRVSSQDIDVSLDGVVWFHLLGSWCSHKLSAWPDDVPRGQPASLIGAVLLGGKI